MIQNVPLEVQRIAAVLEAQCLPVTEDLAAHAPRM